MRNWIKRNTLTYKHSRESSKLSRTFEMVEIRAYWENGTKNVMACRYNSENHSLISLFSQEKIRQQNFWTRLKNSHSDDILRCDLREPIECNLLHFLLFLNYETTLISPGQHYFVTYITDQSISQPTFISNFNKVQPKLAIKSQTENIEE